MPEEARCPYPAGHRVTDGRELRQVREEAAVSGAVRVAERSGYRCEGLPLISVCKFEAGCTAGVIFITGVLI
jgi:hypothetical protein